MDWSELIPSIVKTPITVYKNRKVIQNLWKRFLALTDMGDTDIVILGRPAVGKSVFCDRLLGNTNKLGYKLPGPSTKPDPYPIKAGDWTKLVRVIPGQTSLIERARGIEEAFHTSTLLNGVIYVVDWGYTDLRDDVLKRVLIVDQDLDTVEKLRQYNLKNELEDIKQLMVKIKETYVNSQRPKWLIIAVNKVDLFYENVNSAERYYDLNFNSPFTEIIRSVIQEIGTLNFKCVTLPICCFQKDLEWNNEVIKTKLGGTEIENALLLNLISKIANLSK